MKAWRLDIIMCCCEGCVSCSNRTPSGDVLACIVDPSPPQRTLRSAQFKRLAMVGADPFLPYPFRLKQRVPQRTSATLYANTKARVEDGEVSSASIGTS